MAQNPPPADDPTGAGQVTTGGSAAPASAPVNPYVAAGQATPFETYSAMQRGYFGPLQQDVSPATPQFSDPTMQALAERIYALQQSHQVLNGQQPPDPNSVFARTTAHLSAAEIASQVGQQTWQQSIVQPFTDFVDTWKRDWHAGLMETLGGAAIIGGLIGLEALTGGAATPFIFAASAALVAPSMIKAWGDEMQHPTDSNLVKALVATSTGVIAVGVPVKWAQGMSLGRNSLSFALRSKKETESVAALASSILSGRPELRNMINFKRPIEEQLDVLGNRANEIRAQFEKYNPEGLKDKTVGDLISRTEAMDGLRQAWETAKAIDDPMKVKEIEAEMKVYGQEQVLPLRLQVASHYLFLVDNRFRHIPIGPTELTKALPAQLQRDAAFSASEVMGFIRQLGRGHGLSAEQDLTAKSLVEHRGRDLAAGGTERAIARMKNAHSDMVKNLGLSEEQLQKIELAMEDPQAWEALDGKEQLYGQYRATMHGAMTMAQLRWGTVENAIAGYLPRMFTGTEEAPATAGVRDLFASMRGSMVQRSRLYRAAVDAGGELEYYEKPRAQLLAEEQRASAIYKALRPVRDYMVQNEPRVRAERATIAGYKRHRTRYENKGELEKAAGMQRKIDMHWDVTMATEPKLADLAHMDSNRFETVQRITPSARKLLTGTELFDASIASYAYRMEEASLRAGAETHANMVHSRLKDLFGKKVSPSAYGLEIQQPEFRRGRAIEAGVSEEKLDAMTEAQRAEYMTRFLPDFMHETAFARGTGASRGYKEVFRAIGRPGELHHRPAIYARDEIADEMHRIMDSARTGHEVFSGVSGLLYKTVYGTKRLIMATPFWHAMNVGGRLVAFALDDPSGAATALSTVWGRGEHMLDPEMRATLEMRASQAGLLHANRFEVTNLLHRRMRDNDAQPTWRSVVRTMAGPLPHFYQDMLEGGFWKMVDDMQLAGFQLAEHKLRLKMPNAPESEISRLAAEYSNNLVGMVNPLYMNKTYRHMRNLVWFAPSYWATFTRMLLSLPGTDRLSGFLAHYREGQFVRMGNIPLKAVSESGRRELTRLQRSWVTTYLATGVVAADMMNVMLGGRHLWDNEQGHMFDINVDNFAEWSKHLPVVGGLSPGGPVTLPSGTVQHSYVSAVPFFRQAVDVMDAAGLGHDWGLAHQLTDETWQQADAIHKALMAAGAIADGVRRTASTKLSGLPMGIYGGITGEELSSRLGTGTERKVSGPLGNWSAMASLIPGGLTMERFWAAQAKTEVTGRQPETILGGIPANLPSQLIQQFTGFPSMYHMGPESPPIDDSKMKQWYTERNSLHDALQQASKLLFMGDMSPLGYQRKRQQLIDRLVELDRVTFGDNTPAAALSGARASIAQQVGLDNLGLSDSEWYARYQTFNQIWEATVATASPQARATWWEHEHSQWTDADYLVWEASEMKKAIAAAVDGQGGAYIQAYENQVAALEQMPITAAERTKIEQQDPYYYTYRQLIKAMSRSSALGAFINAFTSPYSETYILEQGLTPAEMEQAALLASGSATLVKPETAKGLASSARELASSPDVAAAGGEATASPEFQKTLQQAIAEAEAQR